MRMIPIACCIFFISFLRHSPTHVPEGNLVCVYMSVSKLVTIQSFRRQDGESVQTLWVCWTRAYLMSMGGENTLFEMRGTRG